MGDILDGKCLGQKKWGGGCKWRCYHHLGALGVDNGSDEQEIAKSDKLRFVVGFSTLMAR